MERFRICARTYGWPTGLKGGGVIGAIVELGGGWIPPGRGKILRDQSRADAVNHRYLFRLMEPPQRTRRGSGLNADGEVALDIQVAARPASMKATGKPASIRM